MSSTITHPELSTKNARQPYRWFKWLVLGGLVAAVVMSLAGYYLGRALRPYEIKGIPLDPPLAAADFTMVSSRSGEPVSLSDFRGKYVLLYFGYATCPDVCPTSLTRYTQSYQMLDQETQQQVQFLWITVDPERDTPEIMEEYLSHFAPEFMLGLVPRSAAELADTARAYGSHYEKVDVGSQSGYLMEHSASVALIDPTGQWRLLYGFSTPPEDVATDLEYLVRQGDKN